ncbi:hypothetical protein CcaCcLH18_09054 [Colletotrichum camelliae]|nr:hypothetical protein CcaCcLH18_09054 [Colletotrichum camelliae]
MGAPEIFTAVATGILALMAVVSGTYQFHSLRKERRLREKVESDLALFNTQRGEDHRSLQAELNEVREMHSSLQAEMNEVKEVLAGHLESCAHLDGTDTDR